MTIALSQFARNLSVETAFTVYSDFENYAGGVYKHVSGSSVGGHAVKIVGWGVDKGTKYWKDEEPNQ